MLLHEHVSTATRESIPKHGTCSHGIMHGVGSTQATRHVQHAYVFKTGTGTTSHAPRLQQATQTRKRLQHLLSNAQTGLERQTQRHLATPTQRPNQPSTPQARPPRKGRSTVNVLGTLRHMHEASRGRFRSMQRLSNAVCATSGQTTAEWIRATGCCTAASAGTCC
jgi:hypothetical protein